jgi:hypothetical protein
MRQSARHDHLSARLRAPCQIKPRAGAGCPRSLARLAAMCDGRAEESHSAKTRTPPEMEKGRGLGNPQMWANYVTRAPLRKLAGRAKGSSRNVRHEYPVGHPLLEMLKHAGFSNGHVDCSSPRRSYPKREFKNQYPL